LEDFLLESLEICLAHFSGMEFGELLEFFDIKKNNNPMEKIIKIQFLLASQSLGINI
jgi:hypothetical protein